jgi:hypothetical protein
MGLSLAVCMRNKPIDNPWVSHQWLLEQVQVNLGQLSEIPKTNKTFQLGAIQGFQVTESDQELWWFTGFHLDLYLDESEGYFLNVTSEKPCWFVMWRLEDNPYQEGASIAVPHRVMLSYNEAARLLDGGEQVDQYPLDRLILESVKEFVTENYRPEVKKRHRPESFKGANRGTPSGGTT